MIEVIRITEEGPLLEEARILFTEYVTALNVDLNFQHINDELAAPLAKYGPPQGCLLLATYHQQSAGCIALQKLPQPYTCEMKRLFTRPHFRQAGIGNILIQQLITSASEMGYKSMVLDTLEHLTPAIKLYQRHGFVKTTAYYHNPLKGVVYMQRVL